MLNKAPNQFTLDTLFECIIHNAVKINNEWVPARPLGFYSLSHRIKLAWMVFTGKADALTWPEDQ